MILDPVNFGILMPIAGMAFAIIIIWLTESRKEREAFQRGELLKNIAQSQGDGAERVLETIHRQEEEAQARRREGMKLGGLITLAVGIGLMIFLASVEPDNPVWTVGLIPALVGGALAFYALYLAPKGGRQ